MSAWFWLGAAITFWVIGLPLAWVVAVEIVRWQERRSQR
jgi:hypothetical protein